jgi:sugar phosphate isomerase/epimerase
MWKMSVVTAPAGLANAPAPLKGTLEETIGNAARIGFDAVQLTIGRPAEFDLAAARAALAAHRIRVSGIATGGAYAIDGLSLGHGDETTRRRAVARMGEFIDLAKALGGADVVIGLIRGRFADADGKPHFMAQYRRSLADCIAHAERQGIRLVHEAIGRTDSDVLRTVRENLELLAEFPSPAFRLQIDTHHMNLEETDFRPAVLAARGVLAQVDISDIGRRCPDGLHFDFPALIAALRQIDYRDHLVFEYAATGDGVAEAAAGLAYIRSLC